MTNAINSVAGVDDFATMVKDLMAERDRLQADLAAARALLREASRYVLPDDERARMLIDRIDAALAGEIRPPVKYGCHCDIETMDPGFQPDDCVFDNGDVEDCIYAIKLQREGKGAKDCEYWKPIKVTP